MTPIASSLILFAVGILIGFLIGFAFGRKFMNMPNWERSGLTIFVSVIWGIAVIYSIINPEVDVPSWLHIIMAAVVGFFFPGQILETFSKNKK